MNKRQDKTEETGALRSTKKTNWLLPFGILLVSVAVLSPLLFSGTWPDSHDGVRYPCLQDQFQEAFREGILYPRWFPDLYGGYGYPTMVFYQPGIFYFSLPFTLLFPGILTGMKLALLALFFLGGMGVFCLAREMDTDRLGSFFCSVLFLLTPYLYVNLYVRGDLSELASMFVCPWPLYFLLLLRRRMREPAGTLAPLCGLILTLAALVVTHPFTAFFYFPLFFLYLIVFASELPSGSRRIFIAHGIEAILISSIISSPYWINTLLMKQYVQYETAITGSFLPENHLLAPWQFFSSFWGFGGSEPGGEADGMSFQLGLPHFILAIAGFIAARRCRAVRYSFIFYILLIASMTPLARLIWGHAPFLNYIQFPWRILSVLATVQVICAMGISRIRLRVSAPLLLRAAAFAIILAVLCGWYRRQFLFETTEGVDISRLVEEHRILRLHKVAVYASTNEFLPRTVHREMKRGRGDRGFIEVSHADCRIFEFPDHGKFRIHYSIDNSREQIIQINQLYFPGWKVWLNGRLIDDAELYGNLDPGGRMQIRLPAGSGQELLAYYEGTPGWKIRNILVGATIILFIIFHFRQWIFRCRRTCI